MKNSEEDVLVLYSEYIDVEQAMHGTQNFFAWDQEATYEDDDWDLQVV